MENKARYTIVGFFILVFTLALVAFLLWLARYDINKNQTKEYRIYLNKSVAGLNENSIVKYKGLEIGLVDTIQINPKNFEQIEIILNITEPKVIKTNTFALISSQGITGNKLIELDGGTVDAKLLEVSPLGYGVIPIKDSLIDTLTSQASSITERANVMFEKLNTLLNDKNLGNIDKILDYTSTSTQKLDQLILDSNQLIRNGNQLIQDQATKSLEHIDVLSQNLTHLSSNINQVLQTDVKEILNNLKETTNASKNIDTIIVEFANTLDKIDSTLDNINENGGDILFKTRATNYGPGEKGNE